MDRRLHTGSVAGLCDGPTAICKGYHCALKPMGNSVGVQSIRTHGSCQYSELQNQGLPLWCGKFDTIRHIHVVAMGLLRVWESLGHAEARDLLLLRLYRYAVGGFSSYRIFLIKTCSASMPRYFTVSVIFTLGIQRFQVEMPCFLPKILTMPLHQPGGMSLRV